MKSLPLIAGLLLLAHPGFSPAEEAEAVKSAVGKVQGVYLRLAQGVFVQKHLMPAHARQAAETWVDVRLAGQVAGAREGVIAQVTGNERVDPGDLVDVRVSPHDGRAPAPLARRVDPLQEKTQVASVRAKYYTAEAMNFATRAESAPQLRSASVSER